MEEDVEKMAAADAFAEDREVCVLLDQVSVLAHLATFGILGVLLRYGLEQLFGPTIAQVTDTSSALFIDLPANMLGCFFMGWVGVVLKKEIAHFSEHLAVGLSTGLMGSITTFASWSQSMVRIITAGCWVRGLLGFLLGMELAMMSLLIGIDSANLLLACKLDDATTEASKSKKPKKLYWRHTTQLLLFVFLSIGLWTMAFFLLFRENDYRRKKLWIACTLAPLGVWLRWWLSNLNGRGVAGRLCWLPTGTLCANVTASLAEFVLNILELLGVVSNHQLLLVSGGIQFGMLGCMSTVSTLAAEIYWLERRAVGWKRCGYAYACLSILVTLLAGLISFSAVAWIHGGVLLLS
ncbi:uncharacterized protein LOC112343034 isoform X1 [Selaginella moellendorffii]|uniref:uncharacterized protein LOC112343034 isoform X1 n=1 Tax=Selaginella moellendorffii TaxID=88036 RepID=UPI000D1C83E3|nr:uncharacterized protein LOC112343034 isoform X1 [Selaginella moellendorffii]|eukprot:XP_024521604.1 uncharacterized protein LOC112343034 isoform X1 [Selaginella moellendorffii]